MHPACVNRHPFKCMYVIHSTFAPNFNQRVYFVSEQDNIEKASIAYTTIYPPDQSSGTQNAVNKKRSPARKKLQKNRPTDP
ncbi:unnamed protein product [Periconia digitata]|uniref:Uncharacterized protein n=1 Tax=Periconia digitata TaxID=1303443 RepID=A0A9W4UBW4_9PLEO|nr:unnamed protein product [Periconia digitata]